MRHERIDESRALGADLRALRKARGLTLATLAARLGRSVGWLSQVERDLSRPSVDDLKALARALDVELSLLFAAGEGASDEAGIIVRRGRRREVGERVPGLVEELLSPDLTDDFEVVHSTFSPGSALPGAHTRPTRELAVMLAGKLDVTIGERRFTVEAGDSFRIRGEPFSWANPYNEPAVAIWVIAPPVY